jgi:hypothetical protein
MTRTKAQILLLIACVPMYGCVVGQSLPMHYQAELMLVAPADSVPVSVSVTDGRPYVVSGNKPPYYIGRYRAGFGNPWDVTTENRQPLADLLEADVVEELKSLGYMTDDSGRTLALTINDWNFDGWQNGRLWYEILVILSASDGTELYSGSVSDEIGVTGTGLGAIKGGMERDMPAIYRSVIRKVVRDNAGLMSALSRQ